MCVRLLPELISFFRIVVIQSCLTLWCGGLQDARLPCPSLSPGVCSNSRPLNWGCHPTISSSVVLEKTLESPKDSKETQPVNPKGNQPWIFTGRTDDEAEAPELWPPDVRNWLTGKEPDAGKDWRQEEKGMTEDEMVGWHHRCNGREFEQTPGDSKGQRILVCYTPRGHRESDMT